MNNREPNNIFINSLFSDETDSFVTPAFSKAGDVVMRIFFRVQKEIPVEITLVMIEGSKFLLKFSHQEGYFDYYMVEMPVEQDFHYYFVIYQQGKSYFYGKTGVAFEEEQAGNTPFVCLPHFKTPDWAKTSVIYQVFVDRFCNGDPKNDVKTNEYFYYHRLVKKMDWDTPVSPIDVNCFYGGDLVGLLEKLDYLSYLGVDALYLNPIFVSPSSHKYDIQDYEYVDPHFTPLVKDEGKTLPEGVTFNEEATLYQCRTTDRENLENANRYFAHFVEKCHEKGIRVILDGVFNHAGSFHKWFNREGIYKKENGYFPGAYESAESPYCDFFYFEDENAWPNNETYMDWWDNKTLPKLNYEKTPTLKKEIFGIAKKWLNPPYNVDGWRLDVAADIGLNAEDNHRFFQEFRQEVKEQKADSLVLAEHYGDPSAWLNGKEWDSVMNYDAFMDPVSYFLTGMEKHSNYYNSDLHGNGKAFFETLLNNMARFPQESLLVAMNELSNHDHSRFLTRTNGTSGNLKTKESRVAGEGLSYATYREGVVMQFTLPGIPTIYYGDETGLVGFTDPDSRRTFPWGKEKWDLIHFHKEMIRIYKAHIALQKGSFIPLLWDDGLVVYGKFTKNEKILVAINHHEKERQVEVPIYLLNTKADGKAIRLIETSESSYNVGKKEIKYTGEMLPLTISAWSGNLFELL